MIVFVVSFHEDMERSLARLYLQQFEATQTKVLQTPHCEYRRPHHLTKELQSIADLLAVENDSSVPPPVGYLSFTFFPSTAKTVERQTKAVELLVNFLPYLDGQVKNTKAMMLSRMRKKKNDLITTLPIPPLSSLSSLSLSASSNSSTNQRAQYIEEVQQALSKALSSMIPYHVDDTQAFVPACRPDVEIGGGGGGRSIQRQVLEARQRVPAFRAKMDASKNVSERCLIESGQNSVRVSFLFKQQIMVQSDPMEAAILFLWMRFLQQQAEDYKILRRKPVRGEDGIEYSVSFLVLHKHLYEYGKADIEDWIVNFCAVMDKECSDIKIQVNAQARYGTIEYFKAF